MGNGPLPKPTRFGRILSVILQQNPDVITLQEIDHHYDYFLPQLQKMGYDGRFQPKHSSKGAEFNGGLPDGVAIFWNTQKIDFIEQFPVGWNGTGSLTNAGVKKGKGNAPDKDLTNTQAKQFVMALHLQMKETKQDFLMMTAHVKSGDKKADEPAKEAQGKEVAKIIAKYNKGPEKMPVIFACDFNNRPGGIAHDSFIGQLTKKKTTVKSAYNQVGTWRCPAGTTKFKGETLKGELTNDEEKIGTIKFWKKVVDHRPLTPAEIEKSLNESRQRETYPICPLCTETRMDELIPASKTKIEELKTGLKAAPEDEKLSKSLKAEKKALLRLQEKTNMLTKEPEFTTTKWRKGGEQVNKRGITNQTIDYIFYTEEIECNAVLDMPREIEPFCMPGWKYPSDHFCVAADLTFKQTETPRRRMAQRERSNRRDSPVMTRLLQEIIDAKDN